jgi:hypothetical protein
MDTIKEGTPLASKGAVDDSESGDEPLWLSIAKGEPEIAKESFQAAGGTGTRTTRTIRPNWQYVDIKWLVKIKTASNGDVHYEVRNTRTANLRLCPPARRPCSAARSLTLGRVSCMYRAHHRQEWKQPHNERTVLTKPKILTVAIELEIVEKRNAPKRYIMRAATYWRLLDAVKAS